MKEQKSAVEENNVNLNKSRCGGAALQHLHVQTCRIATRQNRVRQKNATRGDWRNINKKQPGGVGGWWGGGGGLCVWWWEKERERTVEIGKKEKWLGLVCFECCVPYNAIVAEYEQTMARHRGNGVNQN